MIRQDCYNKYYAVNFYENHIEIEINFIPKDNFNKAKIYFDLVVFYKLIIPLLNITIKFFIMNNN